jgi:hypothetical protein
MKRTFGIACDDYKLARFEDNLNDQGFSDYKITRLKPGVQLISVETTQDKFDQIKKLCVDVEAFFKNRAN